MKIHELVGKYVVFHVDNPVLAKIEDMDNTGYILKIEKTRSSWYSEGDICFMPIDKFILRIQKITPKNLGDYSIKLPNGVIYIQTVFADKDNRTYILNFSDYKWIEVFHRSEKTFDFEQLK